VYLRAQVNSSVDYRQLSDADTNKSRILLNMAGDFYNEYEYDSAYHYAMKSYGLCLKQNYVTGMAKNLNTAALAQAYLGNYEEAKKLVRAGIDICNRNKLEKLKARLLNTFGLCETRQGHYKDAILLYMRSLKLQQKFNDSLQIASAYNNIGVVYSRTDNLLEARGYYKKALAIRVAMKDSASIAMTYNNLGNTYKFTDTARLDSIVYYHSLSLDMAERIGNKFSVAQSHLNLGNYYLNTYKPKEALRHYKTADSMFTDMEVENEIILSRGNISETYFDMKDYQQAKKYGEEALKIAEDAEYEEQISSGHRRLSKVYMALGEYKKAAESYRKHNELWDKLHDQEMSEKLVQARYDFEYDAKQEKMKIEQEKKDLLAHEEKSRQRLIIIAVGIVVVLIFIIVFIFFRNKSRLNRELETRNIIIQDALNDREVLLKEIHHRVKNNLQIISSLLNLQQGLSSSKSSEEILQICESRIQSMAIIHEKLYQSESFKEIVLKEYLIDFIEHIRQSLSLDEKNISVQLESDEIRLDIDRLVPCSLVLNELLINSVKHGLKTSTSGIIGIQCMKEGQLVKILFSDTGSGLPEDFDFNKYQSLGMKLVKGLMRQIKGDIKNMQAEKGACFEISFNLD
jgi:two-component sensor histidine kinase